MGEAAVALNTNRSLEKNVIPFRPASTSRRGALKATAMRPSRPDHGAMAVTLDEQVVLVSPAIPGAEPGSHLWLQLEPKDGAMRVLAQVLGDNQEGTHLRLKHVWPKDRARLA